MSEINKKQKRFISEYIKTLDGELSAQNAGYKSKDLKTCTEKLLSNISIVKAIEKQLRKRSARLQIDKAYVVQKLLEIAEFSLEEEEIYDKNGEYTGRKKFRDASNGLKALEYLSKYLNLNSDNSNENSSEPKIITIKNLDDEKI
ncbi:MAG: terminase small subunit [bacterium]|nr:terminase small subunit [bacterium]